MSYHRTVWIYCDGDDCPLEGDAATDMQDKTAKQARAWLRKDGWINRGRLDFCPECAKEFEA